MWVEGETAEEGKHLYRALTKHIVLIAIFYF